MRRPFLPVALLAVLLTALAPAVAQLPPRDAAAMVIGRVAASSGPVQLRAGQGPWAAAAAGSALVPGQAVRTGPRSQAEIELGADRIGLDPDTVLRLDGAVPGGFAATLEAGRAMVLVRGLQPGQAATVAMPQATVTLGQPGLYVLDAGEGGRPASVGTSRGLAQVFGPGVSLAVPGGQTAVLPAAGPAGLRAGVAEGFLADDPLAFAPLPGIVTPMPGEAGGMPPDLATLPGGEVLLREGEWGATPQYGTVWYPPVAPGWNPYADSWAGAAPWGYAPWFFGTWVLVGPRWGWVPPPPAYRRPGYYPPPSPGGRPPPAYAQPGRPPPNFAPLPNRPPPGRIPPSVGGQPMPPFAGGTMAYPRPYPGAPPVPRGEPGRPGPTIGGVPVDRPQRAIPPSVGGMPVAPPPVRMAAPPVVVAPPRPPQAPPQVGPPPRPMAPPQAASRPPPPRHAPPPQRRCPPGQAC